MNKNMPKQNIPQLVTFTLLAMGCHVQISLNIKKLIMQHSQTAIEHQIDLLKIDVQQQLSYWEHIFSRFDETSELIGLNNNTDQWTDVSAELFEVLQRAIHFVPKTQGLVTPTLLKSLWAAGYKHSFETLPKMSTSSLPVVNDAKFNHVNQHVERIQLRRLDNGQRQVYLPTDMALDLNGYVKGWCAMQLAEQISHVHDWHIPCLVDMGGDMAIGVPSDQIDTPIAWGIAVAKPGINDSEQVQDEEDVAILAINSGAIATSGQDYRRWWHEGSWQHHLIHPHSSHPVISDVLTATVIATDTMTAEVYAKYCVLLGVKEAMTWLRKHHVAAILIDMDNKVMATSAIGSSLVHSNTIQPNLSHPNLMAV